jgi:hypothetical protein
MSNVIIELQQEALNQSTSVSFLLRKALVVAKKLQVKDFEQWASQELNGYGSSSEVPPYRNVVPQLMAHNPYYGWQSVLLDETTYKLVSGAMPIRDAIAVIEDWMQPGVPATSVYLPLNPVLQRSFMKITQKNYEFAFHFQPAKLIGILNGARNTVLEWALELERRGISGKGLSFTPKDREVAASITNVVNYHGSVGQSQVMHHSPGASQSITASQFDHAAVTRVISDIKAKKEELNLSEDENAELNAEIATVEAQLSSPSPKSTIIKESLGTIKRIAEGAMGGALGNILTELARLLF